ncbi:MAG: bifunctional DNA primase/polymerase [Acidobacteria bacterium]|nr:bifunctional DNA primase/polymerase [Acidobacteriota bacterium]
MSAMLNASLACAARGHRVFPLYEILNGQCGCGRSCGTKPGKHPHIKEWTTRATTEEAKIWSWWSKWPTAGIGIATGTLSGLVIVDRDSAEGRAWLEEFGCEHGALPVTVSVSTGREGGGDHFYFGYPIDGPPLRGIRTGKLDLLADGNYAVAPPSPHVSGRTYEWKRGCSVIAEIKPEVAAALRDFILRKSSSQSGTARGAPIRIPQHLWSLASSARRVNANARCVELPPTYSNALVNEIREILKFQDPPNNYDRWRDCGMSLHWASRGEDWGFRLWCDWSRSVSGTLVNGRWVPYDDAKWRTTWESFGRYDGVPRTLASLYRVAIDKGWRRPPRKPSKRVLAGRRTAKRRPYFVGRIVR